MLKGQVHIFEPRQGGRFRISLTYDNPEHAVRGKTSEETDTVQGRFVELVPCMKILEVVEFESQQRELAARMKMTVTFAHVGEGTEVTILCENMPSDIRPEGNEMGCKESLQKLALLLE